MQFSLVILEFIVNYAKYRFFLKYAAYILVQYMRVMLF